MRLYLEDGIGFVVYDCEMTSKQGAVVGDTVAIALLLLAAGLVVTLHVLEPAFDPLHRFMSEYVLGRWGLLMRSAFFALAASGALLAGAMRTRAKWTVPLGLAGWSLGMLLAGVFVTDASLGGAPHTTTGLVHDLAADLAFVSVAVAAFESGPRGRIVALAMVAAVFGGRALDVPGLGQRAFATIAIVWQAAVAARPTSRQAIAHRL